MATAAVATLALGLIFFSPNQSFSGADAKPSGSSQNSAYAAPNQKVEYTGAMALENRTGADAKPEPPEPYLITINGHKEPFAIPIRQGETTHVEVTIHALNSNVTNGNVEVYSAFPICGAPDAPSIRCIPKGISASVSENKVDVGKADAHVIVNFSVPKTMSIGLYPYNIAVETTYAMPGQTTPGTIGNIFAFGLDVQQGQQLPQQGGS